jgi:hypothetical protein
MSTDDTTIDKGTTTEQTLDDLMWDLYFASRIGMGAAEYILEKAGIIEMDQGHVAGIFIEGRSNGWCDCRWILTDSGRRADKAQLESIMLADPRLEIAVRDAELEASIIADMADCEGDGALDGHRRNLVALNERAQRAKREREDAK